MEKFPNDLADYLGVKKAKVEPTEDELRSRFETLASRANVIPIRRTG